MPTCSLLYSFYSLENVKLASKTLHKGPSINDFGNWEEGGVKNGSKLQTDSTKKLPTWGGGGVKSGKIADVVYGWSLIG